MSAVNTGVTTVTKGSQSTASLTAVRVVGSALLFATGGYHLDLYLTGYRYIPTIGKLFVLQVILAFALAVAVLAIPSSARFRRLSLQQLVAGGGALFAIGTLAGFLVSLFHGMFGFKEIRSIQGDVAGIIEIAAFLTLGWVATAEVRPASRRGLVLGIVAACFAILLVVGEATASTVNGSSPTATTAPAGTEITIVIKSFAFHPANPVVQPGEKILVKNEDGVAHTFSSRPGAPAAAAFTTGAIAPGGERVVTAPSEPGSYRFECLIHTFMTGVLTVGAAPG
jgi:plastocyanin